MNRWSTRGMRRGLFALALVLVTAQSALAWHDRPCHRGPRRQRYVAPSAYWVPAPVVRYDDYRDRYDDDDYEYRRHRHRRWRPPFFGGGLGIVTPGFALRLGPPGPGY